MSVLVHKAVEPDNLSVAGKKRFKRLLDGAGIIQPKHDGVYAQFIYEPKAKVWQAFSRTGTQYTSVGAPILDTFDSKALPHLRYNGELWLPETPFTEINGRSRRKTEQHQGLILFDAFDEGIPDEPYSSRANYLFSGEGVRPVASLPLEERSLDDLYDLAAQYKARTSAYDGLILRDPDGLYVPGHGKDGQTIKIKPRATGDFRVVGTTQGIGNRKGGVGALIVALGGGVTCEVGSGLTMADVFDRDFTDKIVEVEYLGVTKDGKLREPVYVRIRDDKDEADVLPANVPGDD